jgi:hypothetical protein
MNLKKLAAAIVANVVLIVLGVYYDIWKLTIGGFVEIVDGAKANPLNKSEVAWGLLKMVMSGVGLIVAVLLCVAVTAAIYGRSIKQALGGVLKRRRKARV